MNTTRPDIATYIQFLLASFTNFTGSRLAELLGCSHDAVSDFLRDHSLTPRSLWNRIKRHLPPERRRRGALILDDTVEDKNFSQKIETARLQWSGNVRKIIMGIGIVSWVHYDPVSDNYLPVDYRLWDAQRDGKSKHDHAQEMFLKAWERDFRPDWVLFDAWYTSLDLLKLIARRELRFFCGVKTNRQVSLPGEEGVYQRVDALEWTEETARTGRQVWLRAFGWVKLFRIVRPLSGGKEEIGYYITNDLSVGDLEEAKAILGQRWKIELYHRELKQLTGVERCQARKQRAQRNHVACAILAWVHLWERAQQLSTTLYQAKEQLLNDYLKHQLTKPTIAVCP
ncbi:MAG: transposase [Candidatus Poribacteria bacterium]|nr:transposase [Candidatus Poribacteria bacterium]